MSPVLPDTIGRFKILQPLGAGGMGAIYLARDPDLGSFVAIKVLTEAQSEDLRQRFLREAKTARALRHPNIVTVYETGIANGMPYIVMEYIQGETLDAIIKRGKMGGVIGIERKLQIMDEICAGLEYAHRKHVVHRDIKPANIMIDEEGVLRVLDFGIARLGAGGGMTQAGQVMGTVNYMPPEQWRGQQVDHRADIFSTGALFYELLSYEKAFPGKDIAAIMQRIINEAPEPLGKFCPDVDSSVIAVVDRCLAKDAKDRYPDFGEVRAALTAARKSAVSSGGGKTISGMGLIGDMGQLRRVRAEQIQRHVDAARKAFEAGDYARARQSCQQALMLEPTEAEAIDLDDRAAAAIEQQQLIRKFLTEANAELQRGAVTAASILVDRALSLNPESSEALAIRDAVDIERRRIAETEAHARILDEAIGDARHYLAAGSFDDALAKIDEALAVDPSNQAAKQLKVDVATAQEAKRRADAEARAAQQRADAEARAAQERVEAEGRARTAIERARQLFGNGERAAGIQILEQFQPATLVTSALGGLRIELREIERREQEERQRQEERDRLRREAAEAEVESEKTRMAGVHDHPDAPTVLSGQAAASVQGAETVLRQHPSAPASDKTVLRGQPALEGLSGETVLHRPVSDAPASETVLRSPLPDAPAPKTVLPKPVEQIESIARQAPIADVDVTPKPKPQAKKQKQKQPEPKQPEARQPEPKQPAPKQPEATQHTAREEKRAFPVAVLAAGVGLVAVVGLVIWLWPSSRPVKTETGPQPSASGEALPASGSNGADPNAVAAAANADATKKTAADAAVAAVAASEKKAAADAAAAAAQTKMKAAAADAAAAIGDAKKKAAADAAIADAEAKKKAAADAAAADEAAKRKAVADKAAANKAAADKAAADKAAADKAAADKVAADRAAANKAAVDKAAADKAAADKAAADKAAADKATADRAAADKTAADKAAADKAAADKADRDRATEEAARLKAAAEGETPALNALLNRYADAWAHRNAQTIKALYPGIGEQKALQDAFDKLTDSTYTIDNCSITMSGKGAEAVCMVKWSNVGKSAKDSGQGQNSRKFTLEKQSGGSWLIKAIK